MEKKKFIYLLVIVLIVTIISVVGYVISKSEMELIYEGTATVIEKRNFRQVILELDDNTTNSKTGELIVNSNIFNLNNKVKIEYMKKGNTLNVVKIEAIANTQKEKARIVSGIRTDVTMRKYREIMKSTVDTSKRDDFADDILELEHFDVLPVKISGQYYDIGLSPSEYFEIKYYLSDTALTSAHADLDITTTVSEDFSILSITNLHNGAIYEVPYKYDDKSFTITSLGYGIYVAQLEFKNGDIINYIFI